MITTSKIEDVKSAIGNAVDRAHSLGYSDGKDDGYKQGFANGYEEGKLNGDYGEGVQAERQRYWDNYLDYGNRKSFAFAFAGIGWKDETFNPPYNLIVNDSAQNMFNGTNITDLKARLEECGVTLDTSGATNLNYAFSQAKLTHIPVISAIKCKNLTQTFRNNQQLVSIEKLIVPAGIIFLDTFALCKKLTDLTVEGVITEDINLGDSPLSRASIDNIFEQLKPFGTVWTKNEKASEGYYTWYQDRETGTYPFDKIKVVLNEGLNPADYQVEYMVGEDGGDTGTIYESFDEKGVCELFPNVTYDNTGFLTIWSVVDAETSVNTLEYTVYEGIIHEAPATPPSAIFKQSAIDAAYTEEEWNAKVLHENKGWTIKTV